MRKEWNEEEIVAGLRRLEKELGHVPRRKEVDQCEYLPVSLTIIRKFGPWAEILEMAGFEPTVHFVTNREKTPEAIIRNLKRFADELGRTPTNRELGFCHYLPSNTTIVREFGSWNGALNAAGLRLNPKCRGGRRVYWTDERILESLREFYERIGRVPYRSAFGKAYSFEFPSYSTVTKKFGSLKNAVIKAGVEEFCERKARWTDEEILEGLRAFCKEIGHTPSYDELRMTYNFRTPRPATVVRRFGSLENAFSKAGIEVIRRSKTRWTDEQILESLRAIYKEIGHAPSCDELKMTYNFRTPCPTTVTERFGSLREAITKAGIKEPGKKFDGRIFGGNKVYWTEERVLESLRMAYEKMGHMPYCKGRSNVPGINMPSYSTVVKKFGSLKNALIEAGIKEK